MTVSVLLHPPKENQFINSVNYLHLTLKYRWEIYISGNLFKFFSTSNSQSKTKPTAYVTKQQIPTLNNHPILPLTKRKKFNSQFLTFPILSSAQRKTPRSRDPWRNGATLFVENDEELANVIHSTCHLPRNLTVKNSTRNKFKFQRNDPDQETHQTIGNFLVRSTLKSFSSLQCWNCKQQRAQLGY